MTFEEQLGSRSTSVYADFFLPALSPHSDVLDVGCGDGALSIGLAAVARHVTAVDAAPDEFAAAQEHAASHEIKNVEFVRADATALQFADDSFDACLCHSVLEAVDDPLAVLEEISRVLKPGGVLGAASVEYDALVLAGPDTDLLRRFYSIREQMWWGWGANPFLGRELRGLLSTAGFVDIEATARVITYGTPERVREFGDGRAQECLDEEYVEEVVSHHLADEEEFAAMAQAWLAWGDAPASFAAFTWCRALGRKPTSEG